MCSDNNAPEEITNETTNLTQGRRGATKQRFKKSIFPGECPEDKQLQSMADREECPEDKQLQSMADREEETASKGTLEEKPPEEENIFVLDNNASEEITNENTDLKQGRKAGSIISQVNEVFGAVKRRFKKSKISGECPGDKQFQSMADREDRIQECTLKFRT
ncbi:uncharacterized protein LOC127860252 [Dreissena polymorpha]|uniref:uncharacterized protein LOC127860252 n=1 Tax=Dreissena polymorpha TaxID=45954 RepID=UPI0022652F1A|nr:uncharacterized protein LOC127860252 [Dreissena polymorpha]